jgi:hypothetical protein
MDAIHQITAIRNLKFLHFLPRQIHRKKRRGGFHILEEPGQHLGTGSTCGPAAVDTRGADGTMLTGLISVGEDSRFGEWPTRDSPRDSRYGQYLLRDCFKPFPPLLETFLEADARTDPNDLILPLSFQNLALWNGG